MCRKYKCEQHSLTLLHAAAFFSSSLSLLSLLTHQKKPARKTERQQLVYAWCFDIERRFFASDIYFSFSSITEASIRIFSNKVAGFMHTRFCVPSRRTRKKEIGNNHTVQCVSCSGKFHTNFSLMCIYVCECVCSFKLLLCAC